MGDKKEWLKFEVKELINMYHGKPELWDVTCRSYKDRMKKHSALTEMAEEFSTTAEEIQRKIHNLRNQFNSEFKKSTRTKSGQDTGELHVSKWPYYDLLLFLQRGSACTPTIGNLSEDAAVEKAANEKTPARTPQTSDFNQDTSKKPEQVNCSIELKPIMQKNNIPDRKRKMEMPTNDLLLQKALRALNEEDQYDVFGKYVASEIRSLSCEYLRKKMKRKFQQVILEISEEDELLSNPAHIYSNPI